MCKMQIKKANKHTMAELKELLEEIYRYLPIGRCVNTFILRGFIIEWKSVSACQDPPTHLGL